MKLKIKTIDYKVKKQDVGKSFIVFVGHPVFITGKFVGKKMREVWNKY